MAGKVEEEGRLDNCFPPGSAILTICERLEAHLAAVFAKTSNGPSSHLHHIDGTGAQTLHACRVGLASQDSGVDLSMVLEEEEERRKFGSFKGASTDAQRRGSDFETQSRRLTSSQT